MSEIADKVRETLEQPDTEKTKEEAQEPDTQKETEKVPEFTEIELEAMELGWKPDGKDKDGEFVTGREFIKRKPMFNKIRNQGNQIDDLMKRVDALQSDNRMIAQASMKENEGLVQELKAEREKHLDNLDVDEVRKVDKQIETVEKKISDSSTPEQTNAQDPDYQEFLKDNEWARDESSAMYMAAKGLAVQYVETHPEAAEGGNNKALFSFLHDRMRKDFSEKFEEKPKPATKVASTRNRSTSNVKNKNRAVTLSDLNAEDQMLFSRMFTQTGKTEQEYMKNYSISDFDYLK